MITDTPKRDFFVHPAAICESSAVGPGTRIWGFSHVLPGARIGRDCNVCSHVFIENDVVLGDRCTIKNGVSLWDRVTLEDDVFVGPSAVFTNDLRPRAYLRKSKAEFLPTVVGRGATIGANATIVCGVKIGPYALIGAGTVVLRDVEPHSLVIGNPGRHRGYVCFCGEKLDERRFCVACSLELGQNSMEAAKARHSGALRS